MLVPLEVEGKGASVECSGGVGLQGVVTNDGVIYFKRIDVNDGIVRDGIVGYGVESADVEGIVGYEGIDKILLDGAVPFECADCVENLMGEEGDVARVAHAVGKEHGDTVGGIVGLVEEEGGVGEAAVFAKDHLLPDEAGIELVASVGRIVVGGEVEQVVGGGTIDKIAVGVDEVVVEGIIPVIVDVLCVSEVELVVVVDGGVVGEELVGCFDLVETDVLGRFVKTGKDVGFVDESRSGIEGGEDGVVLMA